MQSYNLVKCTNARHKAYMEFFDLKKVFYRDKVSILPKII